jgi:hypothetical protein
MIFSRNDNGEKKGNPLRRRVLGGGDSPYLRPRLRYLQHLAVYVPSRLHFRQALELNVGPGKPSPPVSLTRTHSHPHFRGCSEDLTYVFMHYHYY